MLRTVLTLGVIAAAMQGCTGLGDGDAPGHDQDEEQGPLGRIAASLQLADLRGDVSSVQVAVLPAGASCTDTSVAVANALLEAEALPTSLAQGAGGFRPFADALFVLAPGNYHVGATPLAGEQASIQCGIAQADVTVDPNRTTEVLLIAQCTAPSAGGLDVIVALNQPPRIKAIKLDPSKFISVCEVLSIDALAEDPNQDPISYSFALTGGSDLSHLRADGSHATFNGPAGDYEITVSVRDPHGNSSSLSFPIHISEATCAVPAAVQALFAANCAPCHTVNASAGLSLANAEVSYANLIGRPSSNAMCSARTRVIPGDSAQSYLMAKLRGETGICGLQMPRGRPPLAETDQATIAAWIDGLPH
jgi:hypothetical protein